MILFHSIVQILIVPVQYLTADDPTNCLRVGRMFISRHTQWLLPCTIDQTAQETSSCMFVSVFTQHRIEQVSFSINGSVEISPATTDLDVCLVQVPGETSNSTTFSTKILADQRCKSELPYPDCLVTDFESSLQQKFSDVTESELVSQSSENSE